ncbi:MAG: right-handed parallel beta-helix repeat-containing protein [Persicimonas sp.]
MRLISRIAIALATAVTVTTVAAGASAETLEVQPGSSWCDTINAADPGDVVAMAPGDYSETCAIRAEGRSGDRIVVRSADPSDPARFTYDGRSSNVLDLVGGASYLTLEDLYFEPTKSDITAIKNKGAHHVRIEGCEFHGIGGVAIAVNGASEVDRRAITIVDNKFIDLDATGIYIGCHDGSTCQIDQVRIARNLIKNVESDAIGYGLEIKLNSVATIRDNTIYNAKGPALMVYGSDVGDAPSTIEGNYVSGSRTDSAILVGGGPAIVRNNVAKGGKYASIGTQDYGDRGLQSDIVIAHNTALPSDGAAISVDNWSSGSGNVIAHNAILSGSAAPLSPSDPAGTVRKNVACESAGECFEQGEQAPYDLWPKVDGPLHDAVSEASDDWVPSRDFMGVRRSPPLAVGAFERTDRTVDRDLGDGDPRPPRIEDESTGGDDAGSSDTDAADGGMDVGDQEPDATNPRDSATSEQDESGSSSDGSSEGSACSSTGEKPGTPGVWWLVVLVGLVRRFGARRE